MSKIAQVKPNKYIANKYIHPSKSLNWYKLDNAATIYSLISSQKSPSVFRLSCTLKTRINHTFLQTALQNIIPRFPYFNVNLNKGLYWYYWESNQNIPQVLADTKHPCQELPIYDKGVFPFRVRAFYNRISVEFHHSITDGTGALTFLKALVTEYLSLKGINTGNSGDIFTPNQIPFPEEYDYAYKKNYNKKIPFPKPKGSGFKPPLTPVENNEYNIITGTLSVNELLQISRELKVSITDLFTAVYLDALQKVFYELPERSQKNNKKPIRIAVPINLRKLFPSQTMRNFSFMISPEINPKLGKYSFSEILNLVHHSMRKDIDKKFIHQHISRNVYGENLFLLRFTPLFLKRPFGGLLYQKLGEQMYSGKLSNLGSVVMPNDLSDEIENFEFIPARSKSISSGCSVISFNNSLKINWGRTVKEPVIEKHFFRKLVDLGLKVKIESNN